MKINKKENEFVKYHLEYNTWIGKIIKWWRRRNVRELVQIIHAKILKIINEVCDLDDSYTKEEQIFLAGIHSQLKQKIEQEFKEE